MKSIKLLTRLMDMTPELPTSTVFIKGKYGYVRFFLQKSAHVVIFFFFFF